MCQHICRPRLILDCGENLEVSCWSWEDYRTGEGPSKSNSNIKVVTKRGSLSPTPSSVRRTQVVRTFTTTYPKHEDPPDLYGEDEPTTAVTEDSEHDSGSPSGGGSPTDDGSLSQVLPFDRRPSTSTQEVLRPSSDTLTPADTGTQSQRQSYSRPQIHQRKSSTGLMQSRWSTA